ncbi:hypothetical protein [Streptomyces avermitilis]|uniref:hypothetical protein n=1 Tax=Streptomyces avermitilis TaxID=33903 RepID=UPI00367C891E
MGLPDMGRSSVLIDQTMVCEASRLLERVPLGYRGHFPPEDRYLDVGNHEMWSTTTAERLIHLSMLLDAILLYDQVYVLDSGKPPDEASLTLRRVLLERGILNTVDTRTLALPVSAELTQFFANVTADQAPALDYHWHVPDARVAFPDDWLDWQAAPGYVGESVRANLAHEEHHGPHERRILLGALRSELEGSPLHTRLFGREDDLRADPFGTLGFDLLREIGRFHSGGLVGGVSHLRTFVCWRTAAHLGLPFIPSLRRLPAYHLMTDHIRTSVQERVYSAVGEAFHSSVSEVYENERPLPLYLPPALSLFLDHLRTNGDIASAIDTLRRSHRKLRRDLATFQQALEDSATLRDARDARRRLADALSVLRADANGAPPHGAIDQVLDIAPDVVQAAANPLNVSSYADALISRPAEWIRSWWVRRPIRSAFALSDRLLGLSQYDQLLEAATGQRCSDADMARVRNRYGQCLALYGGESRLPASTSPGATPERPSGSGETCQTRGGSIHQGE